MSKPIIVVDVDETLLHYISPFVEFVKKVGYPLDLNSPRDSYDMTSWFLPHEVWGEMNRADLVELINEFNDYPRALPPLRHSYLALLAYAKQYDIVAVSSFGGTPESRQFRKDYLNVLYKNVFSDIILLPLGANKKTILEGLSPEWFIEDSKEQAQSAIELGIKTILIRTPYNSGCEDAIYVSDWVDILEVIELED